MARPLGIADHSMSQDLRIRISPWSEAANGEATQTRPLVGKVTSCPDLEVSESSNQ